MIAKVKIAPMDKWCPEAIERTKRWPNTPKVQGMEIEIETDSMLADTSSPYPVCNGRFWAMKVESVKALNQTSGRPYFPLKQWICEHMLGMD